MRAPPGKETGPQIAMIEPLPLLLAQYRPGLGVQATLKLKLDNYRVNGVIQKTFNRTPLELKRLLAF
jgi:hypothetical protein